MMITKQRKINSKQTVSGFIVSPVSEDLEEGRDSVTLRLAVEVEDVGGVAAVPRRHDLHLDRARFARYKDVDGVARLEEHVDAAGAV